MAIYYGDGSNSNNGRQISSHYDSYDTLLNMNSNSGVNILTINVTPKSANSRFLITASISWSANNNDCYINVRRNSNSIEMSSVFYKTEQTVILAVIIIEVNLINQEKL